MDYHLRFDALCDKLKLGEIIGEPLPLSGGHMHKMFALHTKKRRYAIKALNPDVMLRPEAMQNIINSERIARIAAEHIRAVPGIVINNQCVQEFQGQYYIIFPWVAGRTLDYNKINDRHCIAMGENLAKLHNINFDALGLVDDYSFKEEVYDWAFY